MKDSFKSLHYEMERLKMRWIEDLKKFHQTILDRPSEALAVKDELEKKMQIDRVDFDGITREMHVYKKTVFIIEKNIENLYEQIKRLQAR